MPLRCHLHVVVEEADVGRFRQLQAAIAGRREAQVRTEVFELNSGKIPPDCLVVASILNDDNVLDAPLQKTGETPPEQCIAAIVGDHGGEI